MCGIFFYKGSLLKSNVLHQLANKINHRGPDSTNTIIKNDVFMQFHRLCINDLTNNGMQPFEEKNTKFLLINGEIYNHKDLAEIYNIDSQELKSTSDCEVLFRILNKTQLGGDLNILSEIINSIDGVFAFVYYDSDAETVYFGRDYWGVRPMFCGCNYGEDDKSEILITSEAKAFGHTKFNITAFPPGCIGRYNKNKLKSIPYRIMSQNLNPLGNTDLRIIYQDIKHKLIISVKKRLLSDRKIGCLLSGGFDSSIITSIVCKFIEPQNVNTYSIGLKGSTDLIYAKKVADYLGTNHHEILCDNNDFIEAIPKVIKCIESYDVTTVRASVGMYLVAKYIKENSDDKVIFSGEGADEVAQGYLYFHHAPNATVADFESKRLLNDLYLYDVLRADRTTAAHGLEIRVPFLDKDFVKYYLSIEPHLRNQYRTIEKYLLRKSFTNQGFLPEEIIWRKKEAFSDGVSSTENSWYSIIQKIINEKYTNKQLETKRMEYLLNPPFSKEAMYYRELYETSYSHNAISYYWMPKWINALDPSARVLPCYKT